MSTSRVGVVNGFCSSECNDDPAAVSKSAATNVMYCTGVICGPRPRTVSEEYRTRCALKPCRLSAPVLTGMQFILAATGGSRPGDHCLPRATNRISGSRLLCDRRRLEAVCQTSVAFSWRLLGLHGRG